MYPTAVNNQITDAVTQVNVTTLAGSGANALSNVYQAASAALSASVQNATFGQQQANTIHQATTTQGVNLIYAVDTEAVADAAGKVFRADIPSNAITNILLSSLMSA
jgi:hypothetical protein